MGYVIVTAVCIAVAAVLFKVSNPLLDKLILPESTEALATIENNSDALAQEFDPLKTADIFRYGRMGFLKEEVDSMETNIGMSFFLSQSMPKWFIYLLEKHSRFPSFANSPNVKKFEARTVDILDARKIGHEHLSFDKNGFTLLKMQEPSTTTQWRNRNDVKQFQDEIYPELMKLFPGASRIRFTSNIVRGGSFLGDQPAAVDAPHLDYSQDDAAREAFHEEYPVKDMVLEHLALLGRWDTEEDEMKTLIGIWKPILMTNPVYDHPLAIMDAGTFRREQERPHFLHFDLGFFKIDNLNGAIVFDPDQRWYYYPYQEDTEVLVFTQYSKGRHFANPHSSFRSPSQPSNSTFDSRISVEMRAAVFYPKHKA